MAFDDCAGPGEFQLFFCQFVEIEFFFHLISSFNMYPGHTLHFTKTLSQIQSCSTFGNAGIAGFCGGFFFKAVKISSMARFNC